MRLDKLQSLGQHNSSIRRGFHVFPDSGSSSLNPLFTRFLNSNHPRDYLAGYPNPRGLPLLQQLATEEYDGGSRFASAIREDQDRRFLVQRVQSGFGSLREHKTERGRAQL